MATLCAFSILLFMYPGWAAAALLGVLLLSLRQMRSVACTAGMLCNGAMGVWGSLPGGAARWRRPGAAGHRAWGLAITRPMLHLEHMQSTATACMAGLLYN